MDCYQLPKPDDPGFKSSVEPLQKVIVHEHEPKTVLGKQLSGSMLLSFALEVAEQTNAGGMINVSVALDRVTSIESDRLVETLFEEVTTRINERFDFQG